MVCNWIFYSVTLACPEITKMTQFVMPKMTKITHNLFCIKCRKSRYFCGRILARILRSRKVYEVYHVLLHLMKPLEFCVAPFCNLYDKKSAILVHTSYHIPLCSIGHIMTVYEIKIQRKKVFANNADIGGRGCYTQTHVLR